MGSIIQRKRKDGSTAYLAQIVIKSGGRIVHRENRTFPARREAAGWLARREEQIALEGPQQPQSGPTLAEVIQRYLDESMRAAGRTKRHTLRTVAGMPLGAMRCAEIGSTDVLAMARQISARGVKPQTVQSYLSHLCGVFAIARPAWGVPLDPQAMRDAQLVAGRLGLAGQSRHRERRPEIAELDRLLERLAGIRARRPHTAPVVDIVLFAIFSTRRREEITRLRWQDLDAEHGRVLVRDMKHPGDKEGNHQWCDLTPEALAIVQRQPRDGDLIFPYNPEAVGAAFTRACQHVGIQDLHFHDLRHDGISRLFELGWTIPQVACVSGHRSWHSLKRYTHMRQRGDKYSGWRWLE